MPEVQLAVNGQEYGGWMKMRISRGLDSIAGAFELDVSERWFGQAARWPIREDDPCTVTLDGEEVLAGFVDDRDYRFDANSHGVTITGRAAPAAMVDCSALLGSWELLSTPLERLAHKLAEPFGIRVSLQPGLTLPAPPAKQVVNPGDKAFDVLAEACRMSGVLAIDDGHGGVLITRAGTSRTTTALVEGVNILSASHKRASQDRYARYIVTGQKAGDDNDNGAVVTSVRGSARDADVRRTTRVLVLRAEADATNETATQRARWEATTRAARAEQVVVTVQGWRQEGASGALWPLNALVPVKIPRFDVDGELLISEVAYGLSIDEGTTTDLTLMRADAFTPEPVVQKGGASRFRELDGFK